MNVRVTALRSATSFRHGISLPPDAVGVTAADPRGVFGAAIPVGRPDGWKSASGGAGRTADAAAQAAIGEALERYAAFATRIPERPLRRIGGDHVLHLAEFGLHSPEQRHDPAFPFAAAYGSDARYVPVFSATDNRPAWVPAGLVRLERDATGISTSTGLAAAPSARTALVRAIQELVERDALAVTWLHGVPARRVPLPGADARAVAQLGGDAFAVDATPAFSPHRVAFVAGWLPLRGRRRFGFGAACRASWAEAVEKAFLEWCQAVSYAGYHCAYSARDSSPSPLRTFDDHAAHYTLHPDQWDRLPLLRGDEVDAPVDEQDATPADELHDLVASLTRNGVRLFYRELTTPDVRDAGVRVVRALSPDLALLNCDDEWPFLGDAVRDVGRRYPWVDRGTLRFPNPFPHPLG